MSALPVLGPVLSPYTVKFWASTDLPNGAAIWRGASLPGDGSSLVQVERELADHYNQWHPFLGCRLTIDFGRGPLYRIIEEEFGRLYLAAENMLTQ